MRKEIYEKVSLLAVILLLISLMINPTVARYGTFLGLKICGNVIIPSLFPFVFLSTFIIKCEFFNLKSRFDVITRFLFGINTNEFMLFLLSAIGGYPIGVKLLNEQVRQGRMSEKRASVLAFAFVNSGPAFCVSVIGVGIFDSKEIGLVLYFAGVVTNLIFLEGARFFSRFEKLNVSKKAEKNSVSDCFVLSAYETSTTIITICVFVIFFSFITSYFDLFANKLPVFSKLSLLLEITNAVTRSKNLYLIAFILGFSGLSIILQIFSIAKNFVISKGLFVFSRILNGGINFILVRFFVKSFGVTLPTIQKMIADYGSIVTNPMLCFALLMMIIVFLISITSKNSAWKMCDDVV